jgi:hypothetical protein
MEWKVVDSVKLFAELDDLIKWIPDRSSTSQLVLLLAEVKIVIDSQKAQALYRFAYKTFHQLKLET